MMLSYLRFEEKFKPVHFYEFYNLSIFRNPKYEGEPKTRVRSNTLITPGSTRPETRPRRTMSVSTKQNRPTPRPRLNPKLGSLQEHSSGVDMDNIYSTPWSDQGCIRTRISSVSSSSSSLSSSSSSNPSSPTSLSPEQFWAKYKRTSEGSVFKTLLSKLSISELEPVDSEEPLYAEIYGAKPSQSKISRDLFPIQPPLPRKNSISKPPARPPYPASSIKK